MPVPAARVSLGYFCCCYCFGHADQHIGDHVSGSDLCTLSWFTLLFWRSKLSCRVLLKNAKVLKMLRPFILKMFLSTLSFTVAFSCSGPFLRCVVVIDCCPVEGPSRHVSWQGVCLSAFWQLSDQRTLRVLFTMRTFPQSLPSFRTPPPSHPPLYLGANSKERNFSLQSFHESKKG